MKRYIRVVRLRIVDVLIVFVLESVDVCAGVVPPRYGSIEQGLEVVTIADMRQRAWDGEE